MDYGSSKRSVTAAAVLVVAILVSLGAICVRGVGASQIDNSVADMGRSLP
jgi:hypothetical protein